MESRERIKDSAEQICLIKKKGKFLILWWEKMHKFIFLKENMKMKVLLTSPLETLICKLYPELQT
jgi:hypothetical protein